jgi:hypothetical protein
MIKPHPEGRRLDIDRDLARIRAVETEEARSHGLHPNSERIVDTPAGSAFCLESNGSSEASVACYFFNGSDWTLRYNGYKEFATTYTTS